jgi:hypothetical protein
MFLSGCSSVDKLEEKYSSYLKVSYGADWVINPLYTENYKEGMLFFYESKNGLRMDYIRNRNDVTYTIKAANTDMNPENGVSMHMINDYPDSFYYIGGIITDDNIDRMGLIKPYEAEAKVVKIADNKKLWFIVRESVMEPPYILEGFSKTTKSLGIYKF